MKTIFDQTARKELINRIQSLDENREAQWGKMNIRQMVRHCIMWEEVALGKRKVNRSILSRLFGKLILRGFVKDDSPLRRYLPAVKELKVTEPSPLDLSSGKKEWISLIGEHARMSGTKCELPFVGKVKKEQSGYVAYKHNDHHLRQFNA